MPLHRIYAPKNFFTREEKKDLVNSIADMYIAVGLPPFLVITLFIPVDAEEDFYIGKQSHSERAKEQGKPFVRIVSQHLARTAEGKERRMTTIKKLEDRFRGVLEAKGCEWEVSKVTAPRTEERHTDSKLPMIQIHIEEPAADLWHLSGYDYPAPGTDAEKQWIAANKAVPYEGPTMADHLASKSSL